MEDRKRPAYTIETERFSGPLHLLLELIEHEEMPITEVSLSAVTEQYLRYLDTHEVPADELADFLLVASRLLYLKSQELLPEKKAEEERTGEQLALQVQLYKLFMELAPHIEEAFSLLPKMAERPRPQLPTLKTRAFPSTLTGKVLEEAFARVLRILEPFFALKRTTMERVASVAERMQELRAAIMSRATLAFRDLTSGASRRIDVVVSFLALLELMKQRLVRTRQSATFRDITIERI
ncbi:segregation/condensation protein A [Candidatus Uhrbacteria bacterium]|nr:segregation/condensation protein A [Candidatus Uhrbacteria bacterium]